MKIKCLECGRTIKAKTRQKKYCVECSHQRRIQKDRRYNRSQKGKEKHKQYYEKKGKENYRKWYERNKEKAIEHNREYRIRNIEKLREYERRRQPLRRLYDILYAQKHPFRHTHDKTNDLTVENGRVKGAVWLENQIGKSKEYYERILCSCATLQTPFYIVEENHRTYCFECGGKIVIAFENDYYTITELCCRFCGLVLPQTTP